jgi:hypothetical protein
LVLISSTLQVNEYDKEISTENEENILNDSIEDYKTYFRRFFEKKNDNESNEIDSNILEVNNIKEEILNEKKDEEKNNLNKSRKKKEKSDVNIDFKSIKMMKKQTISIYKNVDFISKKLSQNNNNTNKQNIKNTNTSKINFSLSDNSSENINKIQGRKYYEIFPRKKRSEENESGFSESSESDYRKLYGNKEGDKDKLIKNLIKL